MMLTLDGAIVLLGINVRTTIYATHYYNPKRHIILFVCRKTSGRRKKSEDLLVGLLERKIG